MCDVHRRTAELIKNIRRLIGHKCFSLLASCKSSFPKCRMGFGADDADADAVLPRSRALPAGLRSGILQLHLSPACSSRSRSPRHIVDFRIQRKRVVSPLHVGEEFVACILTGRPSMQATLWRPFPLVFAGSRQRRDPVASHWRSLEAPDSWMIRDGERLCTKELGQASLPEGTRTN